MPLRADFFDLAAFFAGAFARLAEALATVTFCPILARRASLYCIGRKIGGQRRIASLGTIRFVGDRFIGPVVRAAGLHGPCHCPIPRDAPGRGPCFKHQAQSLSAAAVARLRWTDCTSGTASRRHRIGRRARLPTAGRDGSRKPSRCPRNTSNS
jgi:hypothetical protein